MAFYFKKKKKYALNIQCCILHLPERKVKTSRKGKETAHTTTPNNTTKYCIQISEEYSETKKKNFKSEYILISSR
jgi:hypothetical protein